MQYPHPSPRLRAMLVLSLCTAGWARADLLAPERFDPAPEAPLGELRWSVQAPGDHRVQLGAALRRPAGEAPLDPHGQGWQLGLWAQDEWRVSDAVVATGGVQLGRDDAGLRSVSPRASVRWQPMQGLQLRAELERAQGAPARLDADGLLPAATGTATDLARVVGERQLAGDWQLRATAGRARPLDGAPARQGAALALGRSWPGGQRVQAGLAVHENFDGPATRLALDAPVGALLLGARWMAGSGANRVDLRVQSTRWWLDVAGLGPDAPADQRQLRLGANLPF